MNELIRFCLPFVEHNQHSAVDLGHPKQECYSHPSPYLHDIFLLEQFQCRRKKKEFFPQPPISMLLLVSKHWSEAASLAWRLRNCSVNQEVPVWSLASTMGCFPMEGYSSTFSVGPISRARVLAILHKEAPYVKYLLTWF